jgi:hypothetical protein
LTAGCIKKTWLSNYIERRWPDLDDKRLARLLSVHGQNAAGLGRLLRDWCAIRGPPPTAQQQLMNQALAEVGAHLGIDLTGNSPSVQDQQPPIDVEAVIADLDAMQARLARHLAQYDHDNAGIDDNDGDIDRVLRLSAIYGRNASRLGRLLRFRHDIGAELSPEIMQSFVDAAADPDDESARDFACEIVRELGVERALELGIAHARELALELGIEIAGEPGSGPGRPQQEGGDAT